MVTTLAVALLAALTVAAAIYAHRRLPALTPNPAQLWTARLILLALGLGFGWSVVTTYRPLGGADGFWVFLASFGVVHVPAAAVLFIKQQGKRQS